VIHSALSPFALSLSKGRPAFSALSEEGQGFDKLSPNGVGVAIESMEAAHG
jgi:hypothetical protein